METIYIGADKPGKTVGQRGAGLVEEAEPEIFRTEIRLVVPAEAGNIETGAPGCPFLVNIDIEHDAGVILAELFVLDEIAGSQINAEIIFNGPVDTGRGIVHLVVFRRADVIPLNVGVLYIAAEVL
ncbi:MAG: hypothetical protein DNFNHJIP_00031 [Candidatus Argoarchaeum ethanivorans]|uniref:Uncharacterized protein n=1 Tax=Candidatus Argoarchaeum ethanivorans TaxID=2608793 RepID=A0A812A224_9EURY|nr:MAG: hypothetical protein DNFNHJIP_00031 [Candidatus Argoarchaeum ethanivorans]